MTVTILRVAFSIRIEAESDSQAIRVTSASVPEGAFNAEVRVTGHAKPRPDEVREATKQ